MQMRVYTVWIESIITMIQKPHAFPLAWNIYKTPVIKHLLFLTYALSWLWYHIYVKGSIDADIVMRWVWITLTYVCYTLFALHITQFLQWHLGPDHCCMSCLNSLTSLAFFYLFREIIPDFSSLISERIHSKTRCVYGWLYKYNKHLRHTTTKPYWCSLPTDPSIHVDQCVRFLSYYHRRNWIVSIFHASRGRDR